MITGFKPSDFCYLFSSLHPNRWTLPQLHTAFTLNRCRRAHLAHPNLGEFSHCCFWAFPLVSGRNHPSAIYRNSSGYLSLRDNDSAFSLSGMAKLADFLAVGAHFVLLQRSQKYPLSAHSVWPKDVKNLPGATLSKDLSQLLVVKY